MQESAYTDKLKHVTTCFQMRVMDSVPEFKFFSAKVETAMPNEVQVPLSVLSGGLVFN
jgi:hypothetical protein